QDHLKLQVLVEPVRVLAVAAVGRAPRRLHVRDAPRLGPEHAQERLGVHRSRTDLDVERLLDQAAARRPVALQLEDELLQRRALHELPPRANSAITWNERRSRSRWRVMRSWWNAASGWVSACVATPISPGAVLKMRRSSASEGSPSRRPFAGPQLPQTK